MITWLLFVLLAFFSLVFDWFIFIFLFSSFVFFFCSYRVFLCFNRCSLCNRRKRSSAKSKSSCFNHKVHWMPDFLSFLDVFIIQSRHHQEHQSSAVFALAQTFLPFCWRIFFTSCIIFADVSGQVLIISAEILSRSGAIRFFNFFIVFFIASFVEIWQLIFNRCYVRCDDWAFSV